MRRGIFIGKGDTMKKIDEVIKTLDAQIDKHVAPAKIFLKKYFTIFSSTLLLSLAAIFIFRLVNNKPYFTASVISEDLTKLHKVFDEIDKTCNILHVSRERCVIDFLTVEKFIGSEIGCLNLAYPEKWKGPYLQVNPRLQQRHYELVNVDEGLFIVPGNKVRLPTGFVMGRDIVISRTTPLKKLIAPGGMLNYKGQSLGCYLTFKVGDFDGRAVKKQRLNKVNSMIQEFNEAMSFTMDEHNDDQHELHRI